MKKKKRAMGRINRLRYTASANFSLLSLHLRACRRDRKRSTQVHRDQVPKEIQKRLKGMYVSGNTSKKKKKPGNLLFAYTIGKSHLEQRQ